MINRLKSNINNIVTLVMAIIIAIAFTGCAETELASHLIKQSVNSKSKSVGYFKIGSSYKIKGRRYYPKETYNHTETGMASWYGPGFHGKQTANGEIFNQGDLTAAHRTLQLPSIIRVTNLRNGRSVIVRVNDRGPFAHERVLDLSEQAAIILGYKNQGITKIKIELLPEESRKVAQAAKQGRDTRGFEVALNRHRTPSAKPTARAPHSYTPISKQRVTRTASISPRYYIQAGAFSQEQNAQRFSQLLSGIANTNVVSSLSSNGTLYKVRVGPVKNQAEANALLTAVESRSRSNAIIIKE
ncbi:MAG: septal ring lytic transglycosylase RlpA family protein [Alphaproteobacteria bacterium]|nr:septal ring lytic transglycosylase RlpA family protein [Alphaproteobacteria bacterium]